ncbi:MAG: DUF202 domain-containing protein [Propionibacteriaceae bacterium]
MQNERTRLAWQRTILSGLTCSLLVARLLAELALGLAIAVGLVAILSSAALGLFSTRRYLTNQIALHGHGRIAAARTQLVLTALVVVTAIGGIWYVAVQ